MCECCGSHGYLNSNKVLPGRTDQIRVKKYGRINGWSCPPHPLQILGWFFIIVFAITHFAILVFYLPLDWIPAGIIIPAAGFVIHLAYHILALTLDPADPAVRVKGIFEKGVFDRSKQNHVIENSYCYICQTKVSSTSKHCSMCNKCIFDFDHHCKWLNNCVGGRNYKLFLGSCLSAFGTALVMFIIDLYLLIIYITDSEKYLKKSGLQEFQLFPDVVVAKKTYIIFDTVNGLLLLVALVLLGHLLIFHGYLICNKLSTYDYIVQSRQRKAAKDVSDVESAGESDLPPKALDPLTSSHPPHNDDIREQRIYEMQSYGIYTGPEKKEDHHEAASRRQSYDYYSARETSAASRERVSENIYESPSDARSSDEGYDKKKRRRVTSRASSRLELLENELIERNDVPDGYLSSRASTQSLRSRDSGRYDEHRSDMVLEDYTTPMVIRSSRISGNERLSEDDSSEIAKESNRIESVVSRPRSPSPTQTQRLSYIKQTFHTNGDVDRAPSRLLSNTEEGSLHSKISSDTSRAGHDDSGIGQYDDINSPLSTTKTNSISRAGVRHDIQSNSSQLSLSNALESGARPKMNSDIHNQPPVKVDTNEYGKVTESISQPITLSAYNVAPTHNVLLTKNVVSEDEHLIFEDEFVDEMTDTNNEMYEQPAVNGVLDSQDEIRGDSSVNNDNQWCDGDELTKKKLEPYVEAFRRKKVSQYSYGSDSERSEMAIAVLNEETDPSVLKQSLHRVNKLSDAFPTVVDQEKFKKRSLQQPRLRDTESMEELSVVEYNRKKKLKKKRTSTNNDLKPNLPPLRGRKPLSEVSDGRNLDV